jgi:simple sugar transport system ATP-binding protein
MTTPLVELRDIVKSYGPVRSVDGIDLTLAPGEVLGLIGDNGAGKSTLMKVLAGAIEPDSGVIRVDGDEVEFSSPADARERHIDMVYQDLALCDPLIDRVRMHAQARDLLAKLHVRVPSTRQPIANLSGGQRQSVAIARAVSFEPRVLIMDEPTAALAVAEVESVLKLIRRVAESGVGVVLITHRLQDLFEVCDRLQVMYEGRSVAERPIDDLDLETVVALITGRNQENA